MLITSIRADQRDRTTGMYQICYDKKMIILLPAAMHKVKEGSNSGARIKIRRKSQENGQVHSVQSLVQCNQTQVLM